MTKSANSSGKHLPTLIGLSGRKRCGKDTLAAQLIAGHGFVRVAFADPLRNVLSYTNPWLVSTHGETAHLQDLLDRYGGWEGLKAEDRWTGELRRLLQELGVGVRSYVHEDAWADAARTQILQHLERDTPVVVTDVRFLNEVDLIRGLGGVMVRIERSDLPPPTGVDDLHPSETALADPEVLKAELIIDSTPFDSFTDRAITALAELGPRA